jgi:hypothetical protein
VLSRLRSLFTRLEPGRLFRPRKTEGFASAAASSEADPDPVRRLEHLARALALSPVEGRREVRERHAALALDLVRSGALRLTSSELGRLGDELAALDRPLAAAEAYGLAGDEEGEVRSLTQAGAIERLEAVLESRRSRERREASVAAAVREVDELVVTGQRRRAAELCERWRGQDERIDAARQRLDAARVRPPRIRIAAPGREPFDVALGDEVTLGRSGATWTVSSPAIGRRHLAIRRTVSGPVVVDLGSRNGTWLAGARIRGPLPVGAGLDLSLGGEVPIRIEPTAGGGVRVAVAFAGFEAPLGPLAIGRLRVEACGSEWVRASSTSGRLALGSLEIGEPIELQRDDELREQLGGPLKLRVVG